jgi:hypothetical protein
MSQVSVASYTYNSSCTGGKDQEDHSLKPAPSKEFVRPHLKKKTHHKKGLAEWLKQ